MAEVIWRPEARDAMVAIIRDHPETVPRVAQALDRLVATIAADPVVAGESRDPPSRVLSAEPLTVYFTPVQERAEVYIEWVHLQRPRRG